MAAVYVSNIVINTGSDFNQVFNIENSDSNSALNLNAYTVKSQLRKYSNSTSYIDLNAEIIDAFQGIIQIGLSNDVYIKPGRYVYDVVITEPITFTKTRVIEGMALVREGVTK